MQLLFLLGKSQGTIPLHATSVDDTTRGPGTCTLEGVTNFEDPSDLVYLDVLSAGPTLFR